MRTDPRGQTEQGAKRFVSVSVIVPVRNRAGTIRACLEHLFQAATPLSEQGVSVEIVVANDASTDRSKSIVEEVAPNAPVPVRLVNLAERQGPARARNAALSVAQGELVVFVDSDIVVVPGFLLAHLQAYEGAAERAYTVGPVINVADLETALRFPPPTPWDMSMASLHTANASVPRQSLLELGAFDDGYDAYGWEDLDLGRRLKKAGFARVEVKGAVAYHVDPPITIQAQLAARLQKERERGRTALRFLDKHPEFSARLTAQDTSFHVFLNWLMRFGGAITEDNVLAWVDWANRRGWTGLGRVWLAGVVNQAYLAALASSKRDRRGHRLGDGR